MFSITLFSITTGRRYLVVHGIDERRRRDMESCAGDASLCTGVLCSSSRLRQSAGHRELCWGCKSMYGGVV